MKHNRDVNRRRGWSLLEVTIAVTLTSVLLAATAVLLTMLFRSDRQIRGDLLQQQVLARLNWQFRADAHAATACEAGNDAASRCRLTLADGRSVEYSWQPPRLSRVVSWDEETQQRDDFVLPQQAQVRFVVENRADRQFARLQIAPDDAPPRRYATAVRPAEIEALLGLHRQPGEARR